MASRPLHPGPSLIRAIGLALTGSLRRHLARKRLQRIVEANRQSFSTQDYARRRAAMLKFTRARG